MRNSLIAPLVLTALVLPALAAGQPACPPEVQAAKEMAKAVAMAQAKSRPKPLAGARGQEIQAPRGEDVQAPRGQDMQAPRGQDVQAPRGQDVQAPRMAKARTSMLASAQRLIREADIACRERDDPRSAANAKAAMELLKYLQ